MIEKTIRSFLLEVIIIASWKGYSRKITLNFDYDEVKKGIPDVKKQMTVLNSEFKKSSAEAETSGKSIEKLGAKYDFLSIKIKIQEEAVENYRKKLEEAKNATGNNSKAVVNNTVDLKKAEAQLAQTRAELSKVTEVMSYQQNIIDKNSEEWKDLEYQLELISAEYSKASAEAEISGKAVNKLSAEHKSLSDTMKIQEKQIEMFREKLKEATSAENKNEEAIKENTLELVEAEAQLAQTRVELDRVTKELDKNKDILGKTGKEWDELGKKMTDTGKNMTLKLTVPILAAGTASFKLGADLEDTMGKAEVVFQHNAREIEKWSETAIKRFGLSRVTALSMVTDFAAGFNQLGIDMHKSTEWSKVLTERVNDLSTYYNATIEETQNALTAILSGQTEPLKKFQIFMTQANLQQFAYQKGIKKSVQEMTEAEKVQLRYNYVIEKTAKAQGNFNREQDSATAQINLFKESVKELGISFSNQILPIFTPIIEGMNKAIIGLSELSDGTKKFIVIAGGLVALVGPVIFLLGKVFQSITRINGGIEDIPKLIDNIGKAGKLFKGLLDNTQFLGFLKWAGIIAGVAAAIAAVVIALNFLFGKGDQMNQFTKNMSEMFNGMGNSASNIASRGNTISNRYIDGSHRDGLDYVPRDKYLAELHEGERVLTKEENQRYSGGGDTIYITIDAKNVDDFNKVVDLAKNFRQTRRAGVILNG